MVSDPGRRAVGVTHASYGFGAGVHTREEHVGLKLGREKHPLKEWSAKLLSRIPEEADPYSAKSDLCRDAQFDGELAAL